MKELGESGAHAAVGFENGWGDCLWVVFAAFVLFC